MDIRKVKKLIELLEESGIDELEIKEGEESVRISRHSKTPAQQYYAPAPMHCSGCRACRCRRSGCRCRPCCPGRASAERHRCPFANGRYVLSQVFANLAVLR